MNIVMITWHDLGCHLHCYGREDVRSPNVDGLAAEGVRFTNQFSTSPMCSPGRGSMVTGRYPHVNGLIGLTNRGWSLNQDEQTIEGYLRNAGWHTAMIGYQHEARDARELAFDEVWDESKDCDDVAPRVVGFLEDHKKGSKPFFARVGFFQVHRPVMKYPAGDISAIEPLPYLPDLPVLRDQLSRYHACIEHADRAVGMILDALKRTGLDQDTLVIFTTDHGIPFPRAKGTLYDAGLQTALIMRWPGKLPAGSVCNHLISNVDLLPSVLELAGAQADLSHINGHSFCPCLANDAQPVNTEIFGEMSWAEDYNPKRCVRTLTHKYIVNFEAVRRIGLFAAEERRSELIMQLPAKTDDPVPVEELYDIRNDPHELNNLILDKTSLPELNAMRARLRRWMESTNDPLLRGPVVSPNYNKMMTDLFSGAPPPDLTTWPAAPRL